LEHGGEQKGESEVGGEEQERHVEGEGGGMYHRDI